MRHDSEDLPLLYQAIKQDIYDSEERKLSIFVSVLEPDSVCALRILQGVLRNDGIHHSIFPVQSWSQIKTIFSEQINEGEDPKNVIFINCGGTDDATELLQTKENTRITVIDSRRPLHHNLLHMPDDRAVVVCDEGDLDPRPDTSVPVPDGQSDAECSGGEDDSDDDKENLSQGKRRRSREAGEGGTSREVKRRRRRANKQKRKEYYDLGCFYGRPTTCILLNFAQSLHQCDNHSLWLAAVALTDQLVHQRIAQEKYSIYATELETEIQSAGGQEEDPRVQIRVEGNDGELAVATAKNPITRITAGQDFRLPLMRHWTLYDAMLYSPHVAVRLSTWADKGRRQLEELLARMGFRIKECKLDYSEMRVVVQQQLGSKLEEYGHTAQLSDLVFQSFHLHWGYRAPLSATDAVYAISALLESHTTRPTDGLTPTQAFWRAWTALNPGNVEDIRHGLELAKQLQKAILMDAGLVTSRKDIRNTCQFFCSLDLSSVEVNNKGLFTQPMALVRLATFIRDQRSWSQPRRTGQAVVVVGPADATKTCLVVCVAKQPSVNSIQGNQFPLFFKKALETANLQVEYDGFDTCIGKLPADSVQPTLNEMGVVTARGLPGLGELLASTG